MWLLLVAYGGHNDSECGSRAVGCVCTRVCVCVDKELYPQIYLLDQCSSLGAHPWAKARSELRDQKPGRLFFQPCPGGRVCGQPGQLLVRGAQGDRVPCSLRTELHLFKKLCEVVSLILLLKNSRKAPQIVLS